MHDGSIVFNTKIDNSDVEKDLKDLEKKIRSSEDSISKNENAKLPLVKQAEQLGAKLDEAKRNLTYIRQEMTAVQAAMAPGSNPADYMAASADYERVKAALLEQLAAYDLLLLPTAPTAAPLRSTAQGLSHAARYAADRYTVPAALAGLPALSVPFGKSKDGLPIGVQLMGKPLSEALLYGVGSVLEKEGSEQA